jgi:hypothetical protein
MARKFLYLVAGLVAVFIIVLVALRFWAQDLSELAFVPRAEFSPQPNLGPDTYDGPAMWISRPGTPGGDPARWLPEGFHQDEPRPLNAAVFFVHPTSYLGTEAWNAPLDDAESRNRARLFVQGLASPFNRAAEIWAPRYRQAAFGAFLSDKPEAGKALDLAYGDVAQAFDRFLKQADPARPIVLVGHSQGALLIMRLLKDRVAGTPLARRIAAAYVIGWPVSIAHDLPAMGLPACAEPSESGCVVSWASFAEPAEPGAFMPEIPAARALDGKPRTNAPPLCTNPLTGTIGAAAPAKANHGTLVPSNDLTTGKLVAGLVPARCGRRGLLLIGPPPKLGPYVLPGNNYHVYDIPLFWMNLREDFARRMQAWDSKPLPFRGGVGVGHVGTRAPLATAPTPSPSPEGEGG